MGIDRTLLIKEPWIGLICTREKTWEIRRRDTKVRGWIGLTASGSGTVLGVANLKDVHGPYSTADLSAHEDLHRVPSEWLQDYAGDGELYAWEMSGAYAFDEPVPYEHPQGAVIWVRLEPPIELCAGCGEPRIGIHLCDFPTSVVLGVDE